MSDEAIQARLAEIEDNIHHFHDVIESCRKGMMQFHGLKGNDLEQFKDDSHSTILFPDEFKTGDVVVPFDSAKNK